jgi:hypothetical protein
MWTLFSALAKGNFVLIIHQYFHDNIFFMQTLSFKPLY